MPRQCLKLVLVYITLCFSYCCYVFTLYEKLKKYVKEISSLCMSWGSPVAFFLTSSTKCAWRSSYLSGHKDSKLFLSHPGASQVPAKSDSSMTSAHPSGLSLALGFWVHISWGWNALFGSVLVPWQSYPSCSHFSRYPQEYLGEESHLPKFLSSYVLFNGLTIYLVLA